MSFDFSNRNTNFGPSHFAMKVRRSRFIRPPSTISFESGDSSNLSFPYETLRLYCEAKRNTSRSKVSKSASPKNPASTIRAPSKLRQPKNAARDAGSQNLWRRNGDIVQSDESSAGMRFRICTYARVLASRKAL
jgi:hypothetical protein